MVACLPGHVETNKVMVHSRGWTLALQRTWSDELQLETQLSTLKQSALCAQLLSRALPHPLVLAAVPTPTGSPRGATGKSWEHLWCWLLGTGGVSLPTEGALQVLAAVPARRGSGPGWADTGASVGLWAGRAAAPAAPPFSQPPVPRSRELPGGVCPGR